jgi:hypothetical protein
LTDPSMCPTITSKQRSASFTFDICSFVKDKRGGRYPNAYLTGHSWADFNELLDLSYNALIKESSQDSPEAAIGEGQGRVLEGLVGHRVRAVLLHGARVPGHILQRKGEFSISHEEYSQQECYLSILKWRD